MVIFSHHRPWHIGCLLSITPAPNVLSANLLMPTLHHVDPQVTGLHFQQTYKNIGLTWFEDFGSTTLQHQQNQGNKSINIKQFKKMNLLNQSPPTQTQHLNSFSRPSWDHVHRQKKPFKHELVGRFNPLERYESNWIISPGRGENKKCLKPPPRWGVSVCKLVITLRAVVEMFEKTIHMSVGRLCLSTFQVSTFKKKVEPLGKHRDVLGQFRS